MSLGSSALLATLTGLQDHLARVAGLGQFSDLHTDRQNLWNGFIELAIDELAADRDWVFERSDDTLEAQTLITAGTVSITAGLDALVGVGTAWDTAPTVKPGRSIINLGSDPGFYNIPTVTDDTNIVIAPTLGGTTDIAGGSYEIGTPAYVLAADVWMLKTVREIYSNPQELRIETEGKWLRRTRGIWKTGRPTHVVLLGAAGSDTTTNFTVRLWPVPDDNFRYEYTYRKVPTFPSAALDQGPQAQSLVVYKALQMERASSGDLERALYYEKQYEKAVLKWAGKDVFRGSKKRSRLRASWGRFGEVGDLQIVDDPTGTVDP